MPNKGDSFITILKEAHLKWGTLRHSSSRQKIDQEAYLQIPISIAKKFKRYNSNKLNANTEYLCNSKDGFLENKILKASGASKKGNIYAKQFQGNKDLKLLGRWFNEINASPKDKIKITWITSTSIEIEKLYGENNGD